MTISERGLPGAFWNSGVAALAFLSGLFLIMILKVGGPFLLFRQCLFAVRCPRSTAHKIGEESLIILLVYASYQ